MPVGLVAIIIKVPRDVMDRQRGQPLLDRNTNPALDHAQYDPRHPHNRLETTNMRDPRLPWT